MIQFRATVKDVSVRRKEEVKREEGGVAIIRVRRIGKLVLEFDADKINPGDLAEYIRDMDVAIGFSDTQIRMDGVGV